MWAIDLSNGSGGSAPKFYVVATLAEFAAAYVRVREKHAYEIVEGGRSCHAYFDLDAAAASQQALEEASTAADAVEAAARVELALLAASSDLAVDILVLDATRPLDARPSRSA